MKIENQVNSPEQGEALKKLKVKAPSYFVWKYNDAIEDWELKRTRDLYEKEVRKVVPAYLGTELGVLLPDTIEKNGCTYFYKNNKINKIYGLINRFEIGYGDGSWHWVSVRRNKHEAHAKADLLIDLLEKKIIKPEDLNEK